MIPLSKQTKIKLFRAIKEGQFDGEQFPELQLELSNYDWRLISRLWNHRNAGNSLKMILTKQTKIKILRTISIGIFNVQEFPELCVELTNGKLLKDE